MRKRFLLVSLLALVLTVSCAIFAAACAKPTKYTVTWDLGEHVASVEIEGYDYAAQMQFEENTEVFFKVTYDNGYEKSTVSPTATASGEGYKFTVTKDLTIKITAKRILDSISVDWKTTAPVYHAGDVVAAEDIVVTANYATGESEEIDGYEISYTGTNEAFALGDKKFTVSYLGKVVDVNLFENADDAIVAIITIDPTVVSNFDAAAVLAGYNYEVNGNGVITFTISEPLKAAIELPDVSTLTTIGKKGDYTLKGWSNSLPAGLAVSVSVVMNYDARLVEINKITLTSEDAVPYLVIEGAFKAADSAYLYLYEGNDKIELKGDTVTGSEDEAFTLKFDIRKLVDAKYQGKWMDIKFQAQLGARMETQEIDLNDYPANFSNLNDSIEFEYNGTNYQAKYEVHNPTPSQRLLKLVYNTFDGSIDYKLTKNVTLEEREGKPYLVVEGKWVGNQNKTDVEEALANYIADMQNFANWENIDITDKQTLKINDDFTFEITLCLDCITAGGDYIMHQGGGGNFDPAGFDSEVELHIGNFVYTLIEADPHGWGWAWTTIRVKDLGAPAITYTGAELKVEGGKLLYVISGSYANYAKADLEALVINFDLQINDNIAGGGWDRYTDFTKTMTVDEANGTFTVTIDISSLINTDKLLGYTTHFELNAEAKGEPADFKPETDSFSQDVTFNGCNVKLSYEKGSGDGKLFWGCVGITVTAE